MTPGNAAAPTVVLGITFPGGAADTVAGAVADTQVRLSYSEIGTPISVPSGGFVTIKEK
jgi:hypothetical protein